VGNKRRSKATPGFKEMLYTTETHDDDPYGSQKEAP